MRQRGSRVAGFRTAVAVGLSTWTLPTVIAAGQPVNFHPAATPAALLKRQTSCPTNWYSCATQGSEFSNICCMEGQLCSADASSNPACCPAGDVCTGTAPSVIFTPAATAAVSYVPNTYFSFPYMANSFANTAACLSAVSQCSENYAACTSGLDGSGGSGAYGVTVVVPGGGGVTVAPSQTTVGSSAASSICSSLSSVACSGAQSSQCTVGTATAGFVVGSGNAGAPRPTANCQLAGAVVAGVGLGVLVGL